MVCRNLLLIMMQDQKICQILYLNRPKFIFTITKEKKNTFQNIKQLQKKKSTIALLKK